MSKIGKTATRVYEDNGYTRVRYHNTDVVSFNENQIILDTGGWFTKTTKVRMNQASEHFGLELTVFQRDYVFYVAYRGHTIPMNPGIVRLNRATECDVLLKVA